MSLALVTGATGLVGSHIVDRLLQEGWDVRALARNPEHARSILSPRVAIEHGDVLDAGSVARAARGCSTIFHAAANVTVRGGWDAYRVTNVEGTRNVIGAAELARARLLHVSSVAVYGPRSRYDALRRGERTTEDLPLAPLPQRLYYGRSKRESEEMVLRAHSQGRVWAVSIRPSVVYGRRDRQFVPRMAQLMTARVVPLLRRGRTTMAVVHAANVAQGAVAAVTTDAAGGRAYNLANDYELTVRRFFALAAEGMGTRVVFVPVPLWVARQLLNAARGAARVLSRGRYSLLSSSTVDFVSEDNPFSSDLAKRELRWAPEVRPEVGIPDAFRWWKESSRR